MHKDEIIFEFSKKFWHTLYSNDKIAESHRSSAASLKSWFAILGIAFPHLVTHNAGQLELRKYALATFFELSI
jgi:hypothetical protein